VSVRAKTVQFEPQDPFKLDLSAYKTLKLAANGPIEIKNVIEKMYKRNEPTI
jgi:hypothetical protein